MGPVEARSGFQSKSFCASGRSIPGLKSFGASIRPGLEARCGCWRFFIANDDGAATRGGGEEQLRKSYGKRMQPWLAA